MAKPITYHLELWYDAKMIKDIQMDVPLIYPDTGDTYAVHDDMIPEEIMAETEGYFVVMRKRISHMLTEDLNYISVSLDLRKAEPDEIV